MSTLGSGTSVPQSMGGVKTPLPKGYKQTEIGVIPEEWDISALKDFANLNMGQSPDSSYVNEESQGMPFAQGNSDFRKKYFVHTKKFCTEPKKKAKNGDILFSVRAPVGDINIATFDLCIGRGLAAINAKNNQQEYLYQLLMSLSQKLNSSAQGSTFTAINKSDLENIKIPLPPLQEQQKIAEILSTVDQKIDSIDSKIEETQTLKRGLMQRLLSEGIGHSEFKDSEIGRIPTRWEVVTLKEVIKELTGGVSVNSEDRIKHENEFGILKTSAIQNGSFYPMAHKTILETEIERATTNPLADHIIFSRMNTPDLVGESGYVDKDYSDLFLPDRLWQINVKDRNIIHVKWLSYILVSIEVKKKIKSAATGTSNSMKNISKPSLLKINFALPPLEEQKQIAEILSTTDEKLESLRAKKEAFETLKKGLMQKLLSGEVRVK